METLMDMKTLEAHANKETVKEYLRGLNDSDGTSVLETFVNELPEMERKLIQLKFWSDMNHDEISVETGIRRNQVGIILERAISILRQKIITRLAGIESELEIEENTSLVG